LVVNTIWKDPKTNKKSLLLTTQDWSYQKTINNGGANVVVNSHKACFMKAFRLPAAADPNSTATSTELSESLVQHVMGNTGECGSQRVPTEAKELAP
jgi:hypothetical protein